MRQLLDPRATHLAAHALQIDLLHGVRLPVHLADDLVDHAIAAAANLVLDDEVLIGGPRHFVVGWAAPGRVLARFAGAAGWCGAFPRPHLERDGCATGMASIRGPGPTPSQSLFVGRIPPSWAHMQRCGPGPTNRRGGCREVAGRGADEEGGVLACNVSRGRVGGPARGAQEK